MECVVNKMEDFSKFVGFEEETKALFQRIEKGRQVDNEGVVMHMGDCRHLRNELKKLESGINYDKRARGLLE